MSGLCRPPREGVYCTMKKGLLLILLIVGTAGTAVSLFAYGGLVSSTKTCIAASNEYYDRTSGGRSGARYPVNVNCSGTNGCRKLTSSCEWLLRESQRYGDYTVLYFEHARNR